MVYVPPGEIETSWSPTKLVGSPVGESVILKKMAGSGVVTKVVVEGGNVVAGETEDSKHQDLA